MSTVHTKEQSFQLLLGMHCYKLDAKGRIYLPSAIVVSQVFLVFETRGSVLIYQTYEEAIQKASHVHSRVFELKIDKTGRVVIPEILRKECFLLEGSYVLLLGRGTHYEVRPKIHPIVYQLRRLLISIKWQWVK